MLLLMQVFCCEFVRGILLDVAWLQLQRRSIRNFLKCQLIVAVVLAFRIVEGHLILRAEQGSTLSE